MKNYIIWTLQNKNNKLVSNERKDPFISQENRPIVSERSSVICEHPILPDTFTYKS